MENKESPNLIIIGNTAYDTKEYMLEDKIRQKDIGGACLYSAIPASMYYRVGIVSKVGNDFDLNEIKKFDIDFTGLKIIHDTKTTHFYTKFFSEDGQDATTYGEVNDKMVIKYEDIPQKFLEAKHIHFTTSEPKALLKMIKKVKQNSRAIISVDTNKEFESKKEAKEIFDIVDIAFIDKEFKGLIDCNAKTKIIKLGKEGCVLKEKDTEIYQRAIVKENVVDKLGAGDCLNGVFVNLMANGYEKKTALETAVDTATKSIDDYGIINLKIN